MGSGNSDVNSHSVYQGDYVDPVNDPLLGGSMSYEGGEINMNNPQHFSPGELNPSAAPYVNDLNNLKSMFENSAAGSAFNPAFYGKMQETSADQLTTGLQNKYAAMGLSGSSAEMGGLGDALMKNQMSWLNRQQSDEMSAIKGIEGLDTAGYGMTTGIQKDYGNFEDAWNQSIANLLGLQAGQQDSNNQMWGSIIGGGLSGAGAFAGRK